MVSPTTATSEVVRIAAVGDLHYGRVSAGALERLFEEAALAADVLLLCGDLTDYGLPDEARGLAKEIALHSKVPLIAVLGNHDYESGHATDVRDILRDSGVVMLDGDAYEVQGIGFAGVKGFCGGFGRGALGAWGEPVVKQFVQEAVNEAMKLETALARLRTDTRIALLHYAPVQDTVAGESETIYPYLGSGRLEEPLNRFGVSAVFHGHAHRGASTGRTTTGVPVYNVSLPLLMRSTPSAMFRVLEVPRPASSTAAPART